MALIPAIERYSWRAVAARGARRSCWSRGVHISMDGKGRWPGNVYVERLWRSLSRKKSTGMLSMAPISFSRTTFIAERNVPIIVTSSTRMPGAM